MKKLALSLFLLALSVSVLCISASAQINSGNCGDNITWMLDTETGHLELMGSGAMWDYDHTPGAVVEAPWQAYKKSIKSVSIGNGITHIGNYAFYYITDINSVTIPESVTTIGNNAFSYCMNLKSIELPDGITQLADSVFYSCKQLKIDKLPSSLTELGRSAFTDCDSLTYLEIPMGVNTIHEGTFNYCDLLSTLIIPNNNATIERFSLYDCPKLVVYCRSDSVITYCALYNIPRKSPVSLPPKTETLPLDENATDNGICGGNTYWNYYANEGKLVISGTYRTYDYEYTYAFGGSYTAPWKKYADHITTVEVQTGVTGLGEFCFSGMKNISKIYLPEGLNYLGDYAFFECNSLTSIALPKSFATSYSYTFPQSLTEVQGYAGTYAESFAKNNNYVFASFESFLFDGTLSNTATWSLNTKAGILTINGSGHIPDYEYGTAPWYEYRYAIKTIELSDKITRIGNNAFHMCKSLVEIKIPDSIKSFGSECFCACENLKEIHIPDGTTVIPDSAFSSCRSIESIYLPDSVTTISNHAFSNCNKLKEIRIPDSVTSIGNSAFNGTAITSFTVPPHVTELKFLTFKNCSNLTYINIHKNVTHIDENIFYNSEVAICGYKGSTAETFAKDNGIPFIDLESKSGDCNGDGTIDLKDVTAIRRYLAGGYKSAVAEPALDVNSDGTIDLKDVTVIRRYLAGGYGIEIE